ncbi:MAG: PepSY domain-containing protein [Veillonella sp.]|nr:PepSY domain-containing protein [Veillonella sp.]
MKYLIKGFVLAAIVVIGTATVSSVEAISSDEAVQSALARVPGATVANVTEFNRDYENGRLEYEGEIHYNGYEYDFEIDADTGTITKWEVEQEILNRFDSQFFVFLC